MSTIPYLEVFMSSHNIVHIEIPLKDTKHAAEFYGKLFGWKVGVMAEMDYFTFDTESGLGGGFPEIDGEMFQGNDVLLYVESEDLEATLAEIEKTGGKTLKGKTEITGMGWFALFADPSGNRMGLYEPMSS
jgi:predicted enzyme related to lactoylglutathione lyase